MHSRLFRTPLLAIASEWRERSKISHSLLADRYSPVVD
jgi:hypothetical protein